MGGEQPGHMSQSMNQDRNPRHGARRGEDESFTERARDVMRGAGDDASEMWADAYEQGERYYRQGAQAVGNLDGATIGGLIAAGALGFAIGWMVFGRPSYSDDITRRMSQRYR